MLLQPGHIDGDRVVHLTHTTLMVEAVCGEPITHHGQPHDAVACSACFEIVLELGLDATEWYSARAKLQPVDLPRAA